MKKIKIIFPLLAIVLYCSPALAEPDHNIVVKHEVEMSNTAAALPDSQPGSQDGPDKVKIVDTNKKDFKEIRSKKSGLTVIFGSIITALMSLPIS